MKGNPKIHIQVKISVQRVKYIHLDKGLECINIVSEKRALFYLMTSMH